MQDSPTVGTSDIILARGLQGTRFCVDPHTGRIIVEASSRAKIDLSTTRLEQTLNTSIIRDDTQCLRSIPFKLESADAFKQNPNTDTKPGLFSKLRTFFKM